MYTPLAAGSIDGTDTVPHDNGIFRAMCCKYRPSKGITGDPQRTIFVGRLPHDAKEDDLRDAFDKFGRIQKLRIIRDVVTGFSKGYAFIEYEDQYTSQRAQSEMDRTVFDGKEILVARECERTLPGWIPRRLGGGFGGKRESGQLRFGGIDRPFKKPIIVNSKPLRQETRSDSGRDSHNDDRRDSRGADRGRSDYGRDSYNRSRNDRNRRRSRSPYRSRNSNRDGEKYSRA